MTGRILLAATLILACSVALAPGALAQPASAPAAKSGFVTTSDGIRIHYLEAGPPEAKAPAILFVPGWTMPAEIWEKQIAHFAKTHRVVAMDPRSQGESTKPTDGHFPAARAADIKAVVDQLKLAPAVLAGWSMGVTELAAYVDQFGTDTLAGLVLVDGIAGADFSPDMAKGFLSFLNNMQKERRKNTEAFVRSMYKTPQSEDYLKRITEASLRTPTNSAVTLVVGSFFSDNRPALTKIDKPTLIVIAAGSGPWQAVYEDMHKRIAGSRLETIENAGHALFVDQPERFNSLLNDFLKPLGKSVPSSE